MKLRDLSPEIIESLKALRYDRMVEKHESYRWEWSLNHGDVEFLNLGGNDVLLPIPPESHVTIQFVR